MGVTGLWQILHPCARPIKLETLNRKRLAVDASIWIYQFLKAVRDKEGNALRNSHVVGFFRRICKLLFFGIKPVFVFDGGAPVLKRQTVNERKKRREGRREDAVRTAGRLLAVQMQRRAEEEDAKRREERDRDKQEEEAVPDEGLVYVDEIGMTQQERQQTRKFRKKDAYHLPELDVSMSEMGGPNDPRIMSLEELQTYAKQFEAGEDINVYDFSKIDYDSAFFMSLPASDRYNILNAARLRSRLRMGHSKEQLDSMFPDRMAFSKFQIERVRERNELTQRLMHINEGGDTLFGGGRVAGEKGREYVLVKNDGVEGGWALGVISDEGAKQETAIDLDKPAPAPKQEQDGMEDEDEFEDVAIEGLNRLPKRPRLDADDSGASGRENVYSASSRNPRRRRKLKPRADPNSLFVPDEPADEADEEWEEVDESGELFGEGVVEEDEELRRAIEMSLETDDASQARGNSPDEEDDDMIEVFQQSAVPDARPVPKGSGRAIANIVNKRAFEAAPESHEVTSFGVPAPRSDSSDAEEESMDLQATLADSRRKKRKLSPPPPAPPGPKPAGTATNVAKQAGFSGPLPFEKLDLGSSLLGKRKLQERSEEAAGGFENPGLAHKEEKRTEPLPPWFSGDLETNIQKQKAIESEDWKKAREFNRVFHHQETGEARLMRNNRDEVIDLEAEDQPQDFKNGEVVDLEAEDMDVNSSPGGGPATEPDIRMGGVAETVRIEPLDAEESDVRRVPTPKKDTSGPFEMEDQSDEEEVATNQRQQRPSTPEADSRAHDANDERSEGDVLEWSESDDGDHEKREKPINLPSKSASSPSESSEREGQSSSEFEDVQIPTAPPPEIPAPEVQGNLDSSPVNGLVHQESVPEEDFEVFSDPEEEETLRQLTLEAEEHARFASTLNNKSQAQNFADYENELKQLRNQQKKDRRDADEVTHIMIQECQQLLRLFGLPYVTAPMEAEAQCAELVKLGLVDGIVTDDSDCFLFGGTRIYKNMFNQAKFVECYLTSDLEKEFDLTREKLIQVAHLLGSDYTEGLPGIGPVTALEILGEFPTLSEFKTWWNGVQMNAIPKSTDVDRPFRKKFRRNATKLFLPPAFPDARVDVAYTTPDVDSDPEQFQWGVPDLDALRSFLMATIGWSQERTDEVLVPVIKDMNRRMDEGTQSNITAFFDGGIGIGAAGATKNSARGEAFAPRKRVAESSKRMGSALSRMAESAKLRRAETVDDVEADARQDDAEEAQAAHTGREQAPSKTKPKGRVRSKKRKAGSTSGSGSESEEFAQKAPSRPGPSKSRRSKARRPQLE